jgi:hypothetical protein
VRIIRHEKQGNRDWKKKKSIEAKRTERNESEKMKINAGETR